MIPSAIYKEMTIYKAKKSTKIIPIEQEEWFYAISFDKLIYLLIVRANYMIPG